eukprot:7971688-Ditylum_brightwellii.AAC.1
MQILDIKYKGSSINQNTKFQKDTELISKYYACTDDMDEIKYNVKHIAGSEKWTLFSLQCTCIRDCTRYSNASKATQYGYRCRSCKLFQDKIYKNNYFTKICNKLCKRGVA